MRIKTGLTFDDVLLLPRKSDVLPSEVDLKARLTNKININIPLVSAAMDTVTEADLAIAIAKEGGIGIIHKNMPIEEQVDEVVTVKRAASWIIKDPITLSPEDRISTANDIMQEMNIASFPVVENGKVVGILTGRDLRFKKDYNLKIKEVMTKKVITAPMNITVEKAISLLDKNRIEKLPVVDSQGNLKGLITMKDIERTWEYPLTCKDEVGHLRVGGAIGPFGIKRAGALIKAGVDVLVVDTAHGHSMNVITTVKQLKKKFNIPVIAGNVATAVGTESLISAGADAVKVGIGPGAICTTRVISGVGVPQITAIQECAEVGDKHKIPIIADGGIKYSGDIAKAIAAGASTVMVGSLMAGTKESPGRDVYIRGRKFKRYRGMGSIGAMAEGSKDRYMQKYVTDNKKLVPEGIEGIVPYRGTVSEVIYQLIGGLRSSMGYCGVHKIAEMRKKAKFIKITSAGLKESHPHDITITEEAPNYSMNWGW